MAREIPKHIAIIMDGNGRWAKKRLFPRVLGHRRGAEALDRLLKDADGMGVEHITVYAFSTENWKRAEDEVKGLMDLMREYIQDYIRDNDTSRLKIDSIGDLSVLDEDIQRDIKTLKEISKDKPGINLHIAINYGGRDELKRAMQAIADKVKAGELAPEDITEDTVSAHLDSAGVPDPELIIRTSGEYRLSNFLPWQSAYSEFWFTDKLWPDFNINDLKEAIADYQNRDRRFGGRNEGKK
jgi:undecaprenyl diphosphate synthase